MNTINHKKLLGAGYKTSSEMIAKKAYKARMANDPRERGSKAHFESTT